MSVLREDGVRCGAVFSDDRQYRFTLSRSWDVDLPEITFVGLNPSTADETEDDPTVRRCVRFARDWGCGGLMMLNIFALRATDPKVMRRAHEPIGNPENDFVIGMAAGLTERVVACWGAHGDHLLRGRYVQAMLKDMCREKLRVFGLTKLGHPKHPLYLAAATTLREWA